MQTVTVTFPYSTNYGSRTKEYEYYVPVGDEPQPDDLVLISIHESAANTTTQRRSTKEVLVDVSLARVERVNQTAGPLAGKFYLHLISVQEIAAQRLANREAYARLKQASDLLSQMRAIAAKDNEIMLFKALAKTNPELRKLLKQYEQMV